MSIIATVTHTLVLVRAPNRGRFCARNDFPHAQFKYLRKSHMSWNTWHVTQRYELCYAQTHIFDLYEWSSVHFWLYIFVGATGCSGVWLIYCQSEIFIYRNPNSFCGFWFSKDLSTTSFLNSPHQNTGVGEFSAFFRYMCVCFITISWNFIFWNPKNVFGFHMFQKKLKKIFFDFPH